MYYYKLNFCQFYIDCIYVTQTIHKTWLQHEKCPTVSDTIVQNSEINKPESEPDMGQQNTKKGSKLGDKTL